MSNNPGIFRKLFTDTAVYGLGSIVPRIFNFFLVPLHTRVFGPEAYGRITDAYGWIAILNVVLLFGMETAYLRFSTRSGGDEEKSFQTAQTVVTLVSLFMLVLLYSFFFSDFISFRKEEQNLFLYASVTLLTDALCAIPFVRLRLKNKSSIFAALKIANIALLVILNLWFLSGANATPEMVFEANMLANFLFLIYFLPVLIRWRPRLDRSQAEPMLRYSFPVMLTGLAGMTNEMFSRISIDNWLPADFYPGQSPAYVQGIFGACYKFAIFMSLIVQAFRMAAEPFFFSKAEDKNSPKLFATVNHYFTVVATFFMMAICFNLNWLKYLTDEKYWGGLGIVPWLLLGYLWLGIYYNLTVWFKITDKTYFGTLITIVGALLTIFLNFVLIPVFGIMGSATVTFISYFLMAVMCYLLGRNYFPVPYRVFRGLLIVFTGFGTVFLFNHFQTGSVPADFLRGLGATFLTGVILWLIEKDSFRSGFSA
ncbi:MAG: polysaccharide biosynthesis C-terminal domain-containing protein [Cyclobacteriaceae bacterium]